MCKVTKEGEQEGGVERLCKTKEEKGDVSKEDRMCVRERGEK